MRVKGVGLIAMVAWGVCAAEPSSVMSEAYWKLWNADVQAKIDRDIEQNRKADAMLKLTDVTSGTEVKIDQLTHDFIFGAHIFNFNQLGKDEYNRKYKELYGTLFNSATIAFYWKKFELEPGKPRFAEEQRDTETYWNSVKEPKKETHWRRPASDPVVAFCESKGIRLHGHTMTWGNKTWHYPEWVYEQFCPADEKAKITALGKDGLAKLSPAEIAALVPIYTKELNRLFAKRVVELAQHYQGRIDSWDVVNESATDFMKGNMIPGNAICKSVYGWMPGDYTYHSFKIADREFPKEVFLNINDYLNNAAYAAQVIDLRARGCRIDIMGSQMHLFNPKQCLDIAEGKPIESPDVVWKRMETISQAGLPIHLSEITITSPNNDARGQAIQAIIARNLYRLWFSVKPMMGITWWNVVDDCGAPGEPSVSGLFSRDMEPKPSYFALNKLINEEWKTRLTLKAGDQGTVAFRGFKGSYRVSWQDASGHAKEKTFHLAKDGDGIR